MLEDLLPLVVSGLKQVTYVNSRQRRCTELCQVASFCKGPSFSAPEAVTGVIAIASLPLRADDREYSPLRILKDTPLVNKSESFFCLLGAIVVTKDAYICGEQTTKSTASQRSGFM